MKRLFFLIMICGILISCDKSSNKVLLYIRDGSSDLQYMLIKEIGVMSEMLKEAGYAVRIATISGEVLKTDSVTITPDLKLSEVIIDDYAGFMLPCMAAGTTINQQAVAFVSEIVKRGKPLAVQTNSILTLAKAGGLYEKKYAYYTKEIQNAKGWPEFRNGIYSGTGVVQDGMIITSGYCPQMSRASGFKEKDGTAELTRTFINVMKKKN